MKKYVIVICSFCLALYVQAETTWSLRKCIDYAIENNIELRQYGLQVKNSEIDLNSSKNSRLPNLSGSVNESFNLGRSPSMATGVYEENKSLSTSFGVSSGIPIFTGFRIPNEIKVNELNLQAAMAGFKKVQENLALQIAAYYLEVLFKKEIQKIYQEQVLLTKLQVERTQVLVEAGKVAASQLYDIKAQLAKDELNVTTSGNDLQTSLLNLSQVLNLRTTDGFDIEDPDLTDPNLAVRISGSLIQPNDVYDRALGLRPAVKEAEYKLESSFKQLNVAKSGYWPTLNLGVSYNNGFNHVYYKDGTSNTKISEQIKNNYRMAIGLSLDIPIFDRFVTRNQVRKARLEILNQELALQNVKLNLYKDIQQAYQSATAAQAKFASTLKANEAARESFKYAEERYQVGKANVFEYNEAQTKLINSRSEQVQAKYDFIFRTKILDFYQGKDINL